MNPRILIVDDEAPARSRLRTLLGDILVECPHSVIGEACEASQALDLIRAEKPDVLLLDVEMPGMSGMQLAAQLADLPERPAVIFVTAYDAHALQAFEVQAVDYLLKPVRAVRLADAIRRSSGARMRHTSATAQQAAATARRHFSVQERGRGLLVPVSEVLYCKAELKYVTLRTIVREYLVEESLTAIEQEFGAVFVRVHRSALVARDAIIGVERGAQDHETEEGEKSQESWQVILRGVSERLPISRRQWSVVKALVK